MSRGIGLYIGKKHVVGAAVVRSGSDFRVDAYAIESIAEPVLSETEEAIEVAKKNSPEAAAIRAVMEKIKAKNSFARIGISPFHVTTRYFIMPSLPAREKDEAIRYEASRATHMKLGESVFGYSESRHVPNVLSIPANASKSSFIQNTITNLRQGNAEPETIEPDYVPFSRVCASLGFSDIKKAHIMMWFDSDNSVNVTLVSKGIVFLAQDFRLSDDVNQNHEKIRDELHSSLRFLSENAGGVQVEYLFLAGFGDLSKWEAFLAESFSSIQVQAFKLPLNAESDPEHAGALVLAFGLGLGELGVKSPLGEVSLLPKEDKKLRPQYLLGAMGVSAGAICAFFLLVYLFIITPTLYSLEQRKKRAEKPFSAYGAIAAQPFEQIESKAFELNARIQKLEKFEKSRIPMKEALLAAVQTLPAPIWLQTITLSREKGTPENPQEGKEFTRLSLEGVCYMEDADKEARQVNEWVQALSNESRFANHFSNLVVERIQQQKVSRRNTTHFVVTAEA